MQLRSQKLARPVVTCRLTATRIFVMPGSAMATETACTFGGIA